MTTDVGMKTWRMPTKFWIASNCEWYESGHSEILNQNKNSKDPNCLIITVLISNNKLQNDTNVKRRNAQMMPLLMRPNLFISLNENWKMLSLK